MPTRPKNDPLAARLRKLRERMGLLQKDFARYFHVSRTTIVGWEENGPPAKGPTRVFVLQTIKGLEQRVWYHEKKASAAPANSQVGRPVD